MRCAYYAWVAVFDLAWKIGVIAIAIGLCMLMPPGEEGDAGREATAGAADRSAPSLFGDDVRVTLDVPEGRPSARVSLRGGEGEELAQVTYNRTGTITFMLGEAFPTRAGSIASPDGTYRLEVGHAGASYRLRIQPGGASGFAVDHPRLGVREGLGFSSRDELIRDVSSSDSAGDLPRPGRPFGSSESSSPEGPARLLGPP
jgi:hypothetical protein